MPSKAILVIRFAGVMAFGPLTISAWGLTINPLDPDLPLDQHAWVMCAGGGTVGDPVAGAIRATCAQSGSVENPTTLSHVVGTGAATADLRTGMLRSRSTAQALSSDHIGAGGGSWSSLYDTITIDGGYSGTIELRMAVDGSFFKTSGASPYSDATAMRAQFFGFHEVDDPGTGTALVTVFQYPAGEVELEQSDVDGQAAITTNASGNRNWFDPGNVQVGLSLFFSVTPDSPSFSFQARLMTGSKISGYDSNQVEQAATDFGNTARLAVIVPDGVAWHSASGAFLVPAAVPIPATAWLVGSGLLALIVASRRKQRGWMSRDGQEVAR